jgi:membrane-associated protein
MVARSPVDPGQCRACWDRIKANGAASGEAGRTAPVIKPSHARFRRAALVLVVLLTVPTLWFALRTYRSFELLQSAYQVGAPRTSSVRGWMTLGYVARTYRVDLTALIKALDLPRDTGPNTDLRSAAARSKISTFDYVQSVQRAVAALAGNGVGNGAPPSSGWLGALGDKILSAMLVYGYPILALIQLSGAIGAPVPDGVAGAVAGSLVAQGRMSFIAASLVVVIASVLGDVIGYGIGRVISRDVLERHGRWFGYTPARSARVQGLFTRWGLITVFITRTFASYLSPAANLLAGVSRLRFAKFVAAAVVGRALWTAAYLGLGYAIGSDFEAAAGFLGNLSGFLLSGTVLLIAGWIATVSEPVVARSDLPEVTNADSGSRSPRR